jgi:hypothetical protein
VGVHIFKKILIDYLRNFIVAVFVYVRQIILNLT